MRSAQKQQENNAQEEINRMKSILHEKTLLVH